MNDKTNLMEFPCEFHLKVMGKTTDAFESEVVTIVKKHIPDITETAFEFKHSEEKTYVSITARFTATSKKQLDNLYQELSESEHVIIAL